jgi:hypothetical protein
MADNASMYISDPSLLGPKSFEQIEAIRSYQALIVGSRDAGVRLVLDEAIVTVNYMPEGGVAEHMRGFLHYAQMLVRDKERMRYVKSRIRNARSVLSMVIEPGFDEAGSVQEFLFQFNAHMNGLLFVCDTVFDYDGEALGGALGGREEP